MVHENAELSCQGAHRSAVLQVSQAKTAGRTVDGLIAGHLPRSDLTFNSYHSDPSPNPVHTELWQTSCANHTSFQLPSRASRNLPAEAVSHHLFVFMAACCSGILSACWCNTNLTCSVTIAASSNDSKRGSQRCNRKDRHQLLAGGRWVEALKVVEGLLHNLFERSCNNIFSWHQTIP